MYGIYYYLCNIEISRLMKYFIKLTFAAKERPAPFAQGGDGLKSLGTTQPAGFGEFRKWAASVDGTAIDTDQDLSRFVELTASKAEALTGAGVIKVHCRGSMITAYHIAGKYPTYKEITLLFFTVNPVRATVQNGELKFI